jgi:hypothetical protein
MKRQSGLYGSASSRARPDTADSIIQKGPIAVSYVQRPSKALEL